MKKIRAGFMVCGLLLLFLGACGMAKTEEKKRLYEQSEDSDLFL